MRMQFYIIIHSQKKGTKAVTGAVPFQKVNFCLFKVLICTILGVNMYILGANKYILGVKCPF